MSELPNNKDLAHALGQLIFANGGSMLPKDTIRPLADRFELSEELRASLKPGDGQLRWDNRVHWARLVLANEGLLKKHIRGRWELTEHGLTQFESAESPDFTSISNSVIDDIGHSDFGNDDPEYRKRMAGSYVRDARVREQVLKRANGFCEECNEPGFLKMDRKPYLETHHVISLSEQGPDKQHNVIALCATDHRRAHYADNWKELQDKFLAKLSKYKTDN